MEVPFPPDKEARLRQFANRTGREVAQVVEEAVDRMLEYEARFITAVEEGRAAARRGELVRARRRRGAYRASFSHVTRVRWTLLAADDLARIVEHIRLTILTLHQRVAKAIYTGVAALRTFPHCGRLGLAENTRELVFAPWPYIAVSEVVDEDVHVLRIRHASQDWP